MMDIPNEDIRTIVIIICVSVMITILFILNLDIKIIFAENIHFTQSLCAEREFCDFLCALEVEI